jgi:hypothetical protein
VRRLISGSHFEKESSRFAKPNLPIISIWLMKGARDTDSLRRFAPLHMSHCQFLNSGSIFTRIFLYFYISDILMVDEKLIDEIGGIHLN